MHRYLFLLFFIELIFGQDSTSIEDQFKQTELINRKNEINWLKELGYVSLMETSFLGFSYLSKGNKGKYIVSVFDLFIGMAGLSSNPNKSQKNYQFGYNLISILFLSKSIYNINNFGIKNHSSQFPINFISYNILVFTGYYLDFLNDTNLGK
tara:strand:+ start:995 stop:1450 length:456 start_codon:yes stop_codon:yes gene_type:complete